MEISSLSAILRESGVVGAGGAGFPTYGKLSDKADTIILNCAECEPLLKLHRQLLRDYATEIVRAFVLVGQTLGVKDAILGIKAEYESTIEAVEYAISNLGDVGMNVRVHKLPGAYPMGDEVVLIYEATKRVVRPGGLPIEQGVCVFNVETMFNVYNAVNANAGVCRKLVSIVGEVEKPITIWAPIGATLGEVVKYAGAITTNDPVYLVGGPMMGSFKNPAEVVTKTTNAIIVLPRDHTLVMKKQSKLSVSVARAKASCCQCESCTDLCPRHALGHPIEPHLFMRAASHEDVRDTKPFVNTFFCSSCGLCEMYSCPQGLAPRSMMAPVKGALRQAGLKLPAVEAKPVSESREYRRAPEGRLMARLGLNPYDKAAPFDEGVKVEVKKVRIMLSQHIGAPAQPNVSNGSLVKCGDVIAKAADGLSVNIHASIDGVVKEVNEKYIVIEAN